MKNRNKKVAFGLTAVLFAIITVGLYIWGAELCEVYSNPDFAAKVEMAKIIGPVATLSSAFLAIKK